MGKPIICKCENKGADQLRGYREADHRLCFRYSDSIVPLLLKSEISGFYTNVALVCDCTGRFMSDLFGNHIVGFPTRRLISMLSYTGCQFSFPSIFYILNSDIAFVCLIMGFSESLV